MRAVVFRGKSFPLPGYSLGGSCRGYRYVCSTCGENWGKLETGSSGAGGYIISARPCDLHGDSFTRGGSFLSRLLWGDYSGANTLEKALNGLSPELLLHEVNMAINHILKDEK